MKKIAILTSGGDAPGMNCALRSVVRYAFHQGIEVTGYIHGYQGVIENKFRKLGPRDVSNILSLGGTIIKTARSEDFLKKDGREIVYQNLTEKGIEALIVIGGNGSFTGALKLFQEFEFPVIGIPGTIDNDINGTQNTLGFDTALNTAMDAIDKIRDTASSMDRIFLIEVMGRHSGAIAVHSALSGGAEELITPGDTIDMREILNRIDIGRKTGKKSWIIIVAEGAMITGALAKKLKEIVGDVRVTIIGHVQRGGSPSALDRFMGALMGKAAVEALLDGNYCHAIGWENEKAIVYPLEEAIKSKLENYSLLLELVKILT